MEVNRPNNLRALNARIKNAATKPGQTEMRYRTALALVIVGQMLPDGAIKGGSSMAIRYGQGARFTRDLDVARRNELETFQEKFEESLEQGWNGFTGNLVEKSPPRPAGVPTGYVMQPFEIKLQYKGKSWCTVPFELGHNEIDAAVDPELKISDALTQLFVDVGLPKPNPVPVMQLDHQIAQKLHAVSAVNSDRARDLVDLQLIINEEKIDYKSLRQTCCRLFGYRKAQEWPPTIEVGEDWHSLYEEAHTDLNVLKTVDEAVKWANNLIQKIDQTQS